MSRRSLDDTLKLLRALDRTTAIAEIGTVLRTQLRGLGIEAIIASLLPDASTVRSFDRRSFVIVEVPDEWGHRYIANRYAGYDPIVVETRRRPVGFGWHDDGLGRVWGKAATIMGEAAEFGLREGFTVPLATIEGAQAGVTFAGTHLDLSPANRGMLTLVASYAFGHALLALDRSTDRGAALSPREREALQWTAEGKTDWEIGEIMRISEHGVDSHLRGVRTKLNAANRAQAVAEGFRHGLIR